ncbi:MAG: P1 family peptidase [Rhizobiaceae bacterium]|nr:P1 family peptidase [Rhizobiaceae bacterium]
MNPGKTNSITDIEGLRVGNAQDTKLKSGVTALICETPCVASVAVHGGGPGTRDTELLNPENTVENVDGIVLSGGSAYGLDAASGVQAWMRENNRGFAVGPVRVPIVPGAIIFDLINGGNKDWGRFPPYRDMGFEAATKASRSFETGSVGAGCGALVAGLKGGLGTASLTLESGVTIGALFAVNAVGSPLIGNSQHFHAAVFEKQEEFGGHGLPSPLPDNSDELKIKFRAHSSGITNTTIGVIATDAILTKSEAKRLAIAAHDGIARAIYPAHTPMDGDLIFSLANGQSGKKPENNDWADMSAHVANVTSRAICRGVYDAQKEANDMLPTYREAFPA